MPAQRTKTATADPIVDLELLEAGTLKQLVDRFRSKAGAKRAYERLKDQLPQQSGSRPAAWWYFEDDVPEELRQPSEGQDQEELCRRRRAWLGDRFGE